MRAWKAISISKLETLLSHSLQYISHNAHILAIFSNADDGWLLHLRLGDSAGLPYRFTGSAPLRDLQHFPSPAPCPATLDLFFALVSMD